MDLLTFLSILAFLFFILGLPIAFSMIVSSVLYALFNDVNLTFMAMTLFSSLDTFVLIAVPLFLLASELMTESTVAERIFAFANALVGHLPGGLGHVNVCANVIFAGMSGSAVADAAGIGNVCLKSMTKEGFDEPFSAAVTGAAAIIGPIIPPSIPMVIYAMVANQSVGKLFLGGVLPGLIMALSLMIYIYFISKARNYPIGPRVNLKNLWRALRASILPLLTPVILLGSIYGGFCTVTEAAAIAVLYVIILGAFVYGAIGPKTLLSAVKRTLITFGPVMFIFPAAKLVGYVLNLENVPELFGTIMMNFVGSPLIILLLINGLFLVLGCFSDPITNILLFVPIVLPLSKAIHMDPIHFGVMVVLNCMIGLNTPPVGQVLITLKGLCKISYEEIIHAMWPFIFILIVDLFIIVVFPSTVTYIPNLFYK